MRGWLNDVKSYVPPVKIGEVMRASTVGQVIESNNPEFQPGQYVTADGWLAGYFIDNVARSQGRSLNKVPEGVAPELMLKGAGAPD